MISLNESKSSMHNILAELQALLTNTIQSIFNITDEVVVTPVLDKPTQDYQIPTAITLFNKYKPQGSFGFQSAKELGLEIKTKLLSNDLVESLEVNDQGFMFAKIKETYLEKCITDLMKEGVSYKDPKPQTIAVDFSSPNVAKELHVGHLRSTILGESISRIFEFLGHKVFRINHVGDWGTQFGMLICHLKQKYPDYLEHPPAFSDLTGFYKEASKKFQDDPEFKQKAQEMVVHLQSGDPECLKVWEILCAITRTENAKIYKKLGVTSEEFGESFYNPMLPGIVEEMEQKGICELSKGAKCIFMKELGDAPLMIQKSDGGYNYDTTDLAAAKYRIQQLKANRVIILTDFGQQYHFKLIFKAAQMAGWYDPKEVSLEHMGFGLVLGEDGKRMKSRNGDNYPFFELIKEGEKLAMENLTLKLKEGNQLANWTEEEINFTAEKIGVSAIKYFELKQSRNSDYKFSFKKMLDFNGNTAVYLMYSYVRLCSMLKKSGVDEEELKKGEFKVTHPFENYLAMAVLRLPEVINVVVKELAIHKLCDYVYNLAVKISEGYGKYKVLDKEHQQTRLMLILAIKLAMKQAFDLLGIEPLEKI